MKNKAIITALACLTVSVLPCWAALQQPQQSPLAERRGRQEDVWFAWSGRALPDTNAPLMQRVGADPISSLVETRQASEVLLAANTSASSLQPSKQSWFSWWGKAKPDTNAPMMSRDEAPPTSAPAKAQVISEPAPKKEVKEQQPDGGSKGWFSWWGKTKSADAKPIPEERIKHADSVARAGEGLEAPPADAIKQPAVEAGSGSDLRAEQPKGRSSPWRLAAGVLQRSIGGSSMSTTDSYSRNAAISRQGRSVNWRGGHVGSASGYANREYDDGYVAMDDWTVLDGGTGIWGFKNAGQMRDEYIDFHAVTGARTDYSRDTETSTVGWEKSSDREWGGYAAIDWLCYQNYGIQLGFGLSASRASFSGSGSGSTFRDAQSWRTTRTEVTDRYSLAGLNLESGTAPAGWTEDDKGPIIDNIPTYRTTATRQISSGSYEAFNTIAQKVSMDMYTLSIGLSLGFDWWRIQAACMAGPTLNYIDAEGVYDETLYASSNGGEPAVLDSWRDTRAEAEVIAGFYLQAGLFLDVVAGLQLGMFGRYDWLDDFLGSVGQSRYVVKPSGGSYGATLGLSF